MVSECLIILFLFFPLFLYFSITSRSSSTFIDICIYIYNIVVIMLLVHLIYVIGITIHE